MERLKDNNPTKITFRTHQDEGELANQEHDTSDVIDDHRKLKIQNWKEKAKEQFGEIFRRRRKLSKGCSKG